VYYIIILPYCQTFKSIEVIFHIMINDKNEEKDKNNNIDDIINLLNGEEEIIKVTPDDPW